MRLHPLLLGLAFLLGSPYARGDDAPDPRPTPTAEAFVHIESDAPLSLRRNVGRFGDVVCTAPCDRIIRFDPADRFSVEGTFPSAPLFSIGAAGPRVRLRVDTGSHAGLYTGGVLTVLGGGAAVMSGVIFVLAAVGDALGSGDGVEDGIKYGCLGAAIGGGVAMAVGIPLFVLSNTTVEVRPDPVRGAASGMVTVRF
ncbi:hypothetical protein [Polyangium sp. y55x31]|uniref:hypothetical protein n=1 Tax=Polyangium sp. y55x31 TaxID=3042688 RepID=UPI002482C871|nr:hypothetical protein [Polyangium sp. y55x31]MDI1480909.1 hypothetical protein [Polyangium sp. y55x31]